MLAPPAEVEGKRGARTNALAGLTGTWCGAPVMATRFAASTPVLVETICAASGRLVISSNTTMMVMESEVDGFMGRFMSLIMEKLMFWMGSVARDGLLLVIGSVYKSELWLPTWKWPNRWGERIHRIANMASFIEIIPKLLNSEETDPDSIQFLICCQPIILSCGSKVEMSPSWQSN